MRRAFLFMLMALMLTAGGALFAADKAVVVGSKIDTEGSLLGKMIVKLLAAKGIPVVDKVGFGTTDVVRKAIIAGELDIYPEYTGNGGFFFDGTDPNVWKDEKKGYDTVKKLDMDKNGLVWLTPAPANNTWAIAVRKDVADKQKLVSLADMARFVNTGGRMKLAGSEEFITRADALPAFQKAYGFTLKNDQLLSLPEGTRLSRRRPRRAARTASTSAWHTGLTARCSHWGWSCSRTPWACSPSTSPRPSCARTPWRNTLPSMRC